MNSSEIKHQRHHQIIYSYHSYACGTGHHEGRHFKILLYHKHRLWIQNSIINITSKYRLLNTKYSKHRLSTLSREN